MTGFRDGRLDAQTGCAAWGDLWQLNPQDGNYHWGQGCRSGYCNG